MLWGALVVLVVNDHVLKGSGWLPGWLTGKLSDFAWLIVAPVAAARLVRPLGTRLATIATCGCVAVFVAAKIDPRCTAAVSAVLEFVGFPSRIWTDPTDLIALCVVPLSFCITRRLRRGRREETTMQRAWLGIAALACMATSPVGDPPLWVPYLVNHSGTSVELRLRWFADPALCTGTLQDHLPTLVANSDAEQTVTLELGRVIALWPATNIDFVNGCYIPEFDVQADASPPSQACVVVGLRDTSDRVFYLRAWTRRGGESRCQPRIPVYDSPGEDGVAVLIAAPSEPFDVVTHAHVELLNAPN
jgi:hypothetical protein